MEHVSAPTPFFTGSHIMSYPIRPPSASYRTANRFGGTTGRPGWSGSGILSLVIPNLRRYQKRRCRAYMTDMGKKRRHRRFGVRPSRAQQVDRTATSRAPLAEVCGDVGAWTEGHGADHGALRTSGPIAGARPHPEPRKEGSPAMVEGLCIF